MLGGVLAIRQGWNPSSLDRTDREWIAKALREIADHIDCDEFEDVRKYKHYPPLPKQ